MIKIKRIYAAPSESDGFRVLVDRLWPRGMTKARAQVDLWLKDIAPSTELRKWFSHDPQKWQEFYSRYASELESRQDLLDFIRNKGMKEIVTLLFAAKDEMHNEAVIIKEKTNPGELL